MQTHYGINGATDVNDITIQYWDPEDACSSAMIVYPGSSRKGGPILSSDDCESYTPVVNQYLEVLSGYDLYDTESGVFRDFDEI